MKVAILQTGEPPQHLQARFGGYAGMFEHLLADPGLEFSVFDVTKGYWPATVSDFDAYLITGSSAGVYDDLPWIAPLKALLREAKGRAALVGICFGHQIMAEAFGGQVIKSPKGWGVGLNRYEVLEREPWMDDAASIAIPASHQDQVVQPPPGVRVVAASAFTPYAALAYGDQPAISFQCHPEFEPAYAEALIEARRGGRYTDEQADAAIAGLEAPNDNQRVAGWIKAFLAQAVRPATATSPAAAAS